MTAQYAEVLQHQGEKRTLCSQPLGSFLASCASTLKFRATNSALWRGYVGTWSIENDRLYLVGLRGCVATDGVMREVGLDALFPGYPDGVFAHWFTGELRCPSGALLRYVHQGYHSVYEKDLFFRVQRGVVLEERVVVNGQAEAGASQSYVLAALTTFGHEHD